MDQWLASRRSIRTYREEPVDRQRLEELINAVRFSPSGHNRRPVQWLVITDPSEVQRLAGLVADWMRFAIKKMPALAEELKLARVVASWDAGKDRICRKAPHVIVAHALKDDRTAPPACTVALATLELAAPAHGLGACWAGYFNAAAGLFPPMKEALALPEGHAPFGAMLIGEPVYRYRRIPQRKSAQIIWR